MAHGKCLPRATFHSRLDFPLDLADILDFCGTQIESRSQVESQTGIAAEVARQPQAIFTVTPRCSRTMALIRGAGTFIAVKRAARRRIRTGSCDGTQPFH